MWKYLLVCIIILCVIKDVKCLEIKGTYHTWLVTVPIPINIVTQMLPDNVSLHSVNGLTFPTNTHPIMFELGRELNCGPTIFKFLQTNFMEAKFDIPFVKIGSKTESYNQKQFVYVDSIVESMGADLTYKLNSHKADIEMNAGLLQYKINYSGSKLQANFTTDGSWGKVTDFPHFDFYHNILSQTWFGKDIRTCGIHTYKFDEARIRPVKVSLQATEGLFNQHFPLTKFDSNSLQQPFGALEAFLNYTISSPQSC